MISANVSDVSQRGSEWTQACQALLCMGFPRLEYWNGLPFPTPGDLVDPRIEPKSLKSPALAGRFFTPATFFTPVSPGKPHVKINGSL